MNVDGYNYAGDWSNATNDASPLYDEAASPLYGKGDTIDATVQYYLAHGTSRPNTPWASRSMVQGGPEV